MADIPCGQFCTMRCVTSTKVLSGKPTAEAMPVCEIQLHTQSFAHGALQVPSSARTWRGQSGGVGTWQARVIAGGISERRWDHVVPRAHVPVGRTITRGVSRGSPPTGGGVGRRRAVPGCCCASPLRRASSEPCSAPQTSSTAVQLSSTLPIGRPCPQSDARDR